MSVNFYLDSKVDRHGDSPIRMRITINRVSVLTTSGVKSPEKAWDAARRQMRRGTSNGAGEPWTEVNGRLAAIVSHFADLEAKVEEGSARVSEASLRAEVAKVFGRKKVKGAAKKSAEAKTAPEPGKGRPSSLARLDRKVARAAGGKAANLSFVELWDMFVEERSEANDWGKATHDKFKGLMRHILAYVPDPRFSDFDSRGLARFAASMREKAGLKNSTAAKQISYLKWFLKWATAKGYNSITDFQDFSPKLRTAQRRVVFLEREELARIMAYDVPKAGTEVTLRTWEGEEYTKRVEAKAGLEHARDILCFCCLTSLRYSDAQNLRRSDISGGVMTITTQKTADTLRIELNRPAREILARYEGKEGEYALPRLTNQKMNHYVKDLCELCGINRPVTQTFYRGSERIDETRPKYEHIGSHTGRRTFICHALSMGIPAEIVMKWTGHSDYKAMKPYIDIVNDAKAAQMEKFDNFLDSPL